MRHLHRHDEHPARADARHPPRVRTVEVTVASCLFVSQSPGVQVFKRSHASADSHRQAYKDNSRRACDHACDHMRPHVTMHAMVPVRRCCTHTHTKSAYRQHLRTSRSLLLRGLRPACSHTTSHPLRIRCERWLPRAAASVVCDSN